MIPFLLFRITTGAAAAPIPGDEVTTAEAVFVRACTSTDAPFGRAVTTTDIPFVRAVTTKDAER